MSKVQEGDRVGAMKSANNETVYLFGYGVYLGRQPCPEMQDTPNPCIKLDDGTIVWGYESWWGPEDFIRSRIDGREVVIVKPDRER